MSLLPVLLIACSTISIDAGPAGSTAYHAGTHQAVRSSGCGKDPPAGWELGQTTTATGKYVGLEWTYRIYLPKAYDKNTPMPLILQHPGWGMNAAVEERGAGITEFADSRGFISVTPRGMNDNTNKTSGLPRSGGPWFSWNAVGTTQSPGPAGATCTDDANYPSYCYDSCRVCHDRPQCSWTTCEETVTPTGTGYGPVGGFIPGLYDTLEDLLCIDTSREYAAGESNGGMMTYQLGVDLSSRLAAIAPQFGSFHRGFNMVPKVGVPVIDTHGSNDNIVPANVSLSGDGYYYTPVSEIFHGNSYSTGWVTANGCSGGPSHYPTTYDGIRDLYCVSEGNCAGGDVVRCAYTGGHNWFNGGGTDNGGLVTEFLLKWKKSSHIGRGYSEGDAMGPANLLQDIAVVASDQKVSTRSAPAQQQEQALLADSAGHYGNPVKGCLPDEDVIPAGTGHVCAPRIGTKSSESSPPSPKCKLGGISSLSNGCPTDANITSTKAWPICLAKGNTTGAYDRGEFHCMLVCPCDAGNGNAGQCSAEAHAYCPQGAMCERGELRKRDQGVCTYPIQQIGSSISTLVV